MPEIQLTETAFTLNENTSLHPDENKCMFKNKIKSLTKWFAEFIRSFLIYSILYQANCI